MLIALRGFSTVAELARDLGYDRSEKLARLMRSPDAEPSAEIIKDVANKYVNLDLKWWLTGEGHPCLDKGDRLVTDTEATLGLWQLPNPKNQADSSQTVSREWQSKQEPSPTGNIIVLDTKAAAGWFRNYGSQEYLAGKPRIALPGNQYRGPGMMAIQVAGDSMEPGIMDEDWLVVREVTDRELVRDGRIYVVVTKGGAVAKRLRRALGGEAFILESDNPAYKPYTVGADEGPIVYDVLALLREKVDVQPHSLFQRLLRMEQDLATLRPGKKR